MAQKKEIQRNSRFPENSGNILGKLEFWYSEFKTKFSDKKWVGMIPNILDLAQNSKFWRIPRFPENSWKDYRNIWILKFWLQNQFQWLKLSGNDTQYVGIGPKQQILENFQISRKFLERFQKYLNFEILSSKSSSVTKSEWEKYPIHWNWSKSVNSRQFPDFPTSRFQKITDVAKSVQNYYEYVVLIVSANI